MEDPLLPPPTAPQEAELEVDPPQPLYPDPFYCPLTQKVMKDPVVGPNGDSFERIAVLQRDAKDAALRQQKEEEEQQQQQRTYYPNRALHAIIVKEKHRITEQGSMRGALHRAEESLRAGFQQVLEKSALPTRDYRPLPDAYYCPITLDIISRPAIDSEGNTYERQAILGWIRANNNSPLTRNVLSAEQLRDNNALEELIDAEVNKKEGSIHPSIRRWKETQSEREDEESSPYPTSQEEIDESSAGRLVCSLTSIVFVFIAIGFAFAFVPVELFLLVLIILVCAGKSRDEDSGQ